MDRRTALGAVSALALVPAMRRLARADAPTPEAIFAGAKDAWRRRREAPFVVFGLRERYVWRDRVHDNWWQAAYRDRDRNVAVRRVIVPADEDLRLKGAPIALNLHLHRGHMHADSLDTNPNADAFPVLDPLIEPNASFGLVRSEPKATLSGAQTAFGAPSDAAPGPSPTPSQRGGRDPSASTPSPAPSSGQPLRELVRVEAVARDYTIALAGTERVRGDDTYHLTLVPLRQPNVYRLRDLWIDTTSFATVQAAVQGLFQGRPYDDARWIVDYVAIDGRSYVQQIRADESLRFGLDRIVTNLQYDFVQYEFPANIPDMMFERLL